MKLYGSLTSPFVRVCRIAAMELGLGAQVDMAPTVVRPTEPNRDFGAKVNPLRRVPALETDEGEVFIDSRVIVEFLNKAAKGDIVPSGAAARIACFNRHAVVSGAIESLVSAMYETRLRPEALRWQAWADDCVDKAKAALDWVEAEIGAFEESFDLATITLVCLLDYAAFRFPSIDWYEGRPRIAALRHAANDRPSVAATMPKE